TSGARWSSPLWQSLSLLPGEHPADVSPSHQSESRSNGPCYTASSLALRCERKYPKVFVGEIVDMAKSWAKKTFSRIPLSLPPALHYPAYRAFWLGLLASVSGFQILRFGQYWLIYQLTASPVALGYMGIASGVPAICLNLFVGVFSCTLDPRRLIMTTQSLTAGLIFLLATLTFLDVVQVWHVLVIAFCAGAVEPFAQPARQALYPHLIDRKVMLSAVALNSSIWQGTRVIAP